MIYGTLAVTEESTATTGATWLRNITIQGEMSSSSGSFGVGVGVGVAGGPTLAAAQQSQGVAALLVMLAVLCFIFAYCCWGAPFCRSLCRRHCCCRLEDPEPDSRFGNSDQTMVATPTIILLPHGRMLVVDGTMFTQFQADPTGLDLVELGDSVLRAQRNPRSINRHQLQNSQGSILEMDAETPSKDSLGSIACFPPPTYESIYGKEETDMPPSYSDILLHRFANLPHELEMRDFCHNDKEEIEMQSLEDCPHIVDNPSNVLPYPFLITTFSSPNSPRRTVSRNPSIISNPLDNYYMDNDLGLYRLSQEMVHRVSSNTNLNTYRTSHDGITFQLFHENENHQRENAMDNENHRLNSQNVNRNNEQRYAHRVDEMTNPASENITIENDIMNTRNRARSISRISNDSNTNRERVSRNNDEQPGVAFVRHVNSHETETSLDVPHEMCNVNRVNEISQSQLYREQSSGRNVHLQNTQTNEINQNNEASPNVRYLHRSRRNEDESRTQNAEDSEYPDDDAAAGNFGALADIRESRV